MKDSNKLKSKKNAKINKNGVSGKKVNKKTNPAKALKSKRPKFYDKSNLNKKLNVKGFSFDKKILFFLLKFFFIFAVLSILIDFAPLGILNSSIAGLSSSLVGLNSQGNLIMVGNNGFLVNNSCTGLVSVSILAAVIFSLKRPVLQKKLFLFVGGAVLLLLLNIPRVSLVLLSAKAGFDAELIHTLTWFLMSAFILLIWYFGTKRVAKINEFSELL